MKIEHIAVWTKDLEKLKNFYEKYFGVKSNKKYTNPAKGFSSYFLSFESGARLEIMQIANLENHSSHPEKNYSGLAHFAISVGSKEKVDKLTSKLQADGYKVLDGPRTTGDGYYESSVFDPDNNRIEITI